jgi:hypothetical protein
MSRENPTWGAPRIHGELLMLGFEVAQSTVSKYMPQGKRPRSQGWKTFLRNQAQAIAAVDRLCRRELVWINVTAHPTAVRIVSGSTTFATPSRLGQSRVIQSTVPMILQHLDFWDSEVCEPS